MPRFTTVSEFFFAFIGWHTIALPWLIQLLATSKSWLQNVWWTDDLCLRLKPTCLLTMSHHGAAGASQLVTLYTRVQGCVRGRQGRGQGQGQIISDQGHVRLWNPTWLVRLHRSTPYYYSSVLTTQSFAYYYYFHTQKFNVLRPDLLKAKAKTARCRGQGHKILSSRYPRGRGQSLRTLSLLVSTGPVTAKILEMSWLMLRLDLIKLLINLAHVDLFYFLLNY